jgi:hypothetical protein
MFDLNIKISHLANAKGKKGSIDSKSNFLCRPFILLLINGYDQSLIIPIIRLFYSFETPMMLQTILTRGGIN